jgi:hypothetical protein
MKRVKASSTIRPIFYSISLNSPFGIILGDPSLWLCASSYEHSDVLVSHSKLILIARWECVLILWSAFVILILTKALNPSPFNRTDLIDGRIFTGLSKSEKAL